MIQPSTLADTEVRAECAANAERAELDTRREGRIMLFGGATIGVAALIGACIYRQINAEQTLQYEITLFAMLTATVMTIFGMWERLQRRNRASIKLALLMQARTQDAVAVLPDILARLQVLEEKVEKVPTYSQGVIDGATMRARVMDDSAG